jgi:hypothetical protein
VERFWERPYTLKFAVGIEDTHHPTGLFRYGHVRSRAGRWRGFPSDRDARSKGVSDRDGEDIGALRKEREQKEDGRHIIFYTFEDEEEGED